MLTIAYPLSKKISQSNFHTPPFIKNPVTPQVNRKKKQTINYKK